MPKCVTRGGAHLRDLAPGPQLEANAQEGEKYFRGGQITYTGIMYYSRPNQSFVGGAKFFSRGGAPPPPEILPGCGPAWHLGNAASKKHRSGGKPLATASNLIGLGIELMASRAETMSVTTDNDLHSYQSIAIKAKLLNYIFSKAQLKSHCCKTYIRFY